MSPKISFRRRALLLLLCFVLCLSLCACTLGKNSISVVYFDADGTLIATEQVSADYNPKSRELPEDSDLWHYTEWELTLSGDITVCTAKRISKTKVVFKDFDGTVLKECFFTENESEPTLSLPDSTQQWEYTSWEKDVSDNTIVYTAQKTPNKNYFSGNVFQIVIKDEQGTPLATGSGFVVNEEGWFITNNHVMEDSYSATAFFDIPDSTQGTKYTSLNVLGGVYHDATKDVFIGKLENYGKLQEFYRPISFTQEYEQEEACYSVGYPNSSVTMEINSGTVLSEYSDIFDKINGIYYLLSDSYIAPGSSGGILINENFEVLGITSVGFYTDESHRTYLYGGSIPSALFQIHLASLEDSQIEPLYIIYNH